MRAGQSQSKKYEKIYSFNHSNHPRHIFSPLYGAHFQNASSAILKPTSLPYQYTLSYSMAIALPANTIWKENGTASV